MQQKPRTIFIRRQNKKEGHRVFIDSIHLLVDVVTVKGPQARPGYVEYDGRVDDKDQTPVILRVNLKDENVPPGTMYVLGFDTSGGY